MEYFKKQKKRFGLFHESLREFDQSIIKKENKV